MSVTNKYGMSIPMAVMALYDEYDHNSDPSTISATSLLKPTRALVLGRKGTEVKDIDVMDLIPSARGTALHTHFERAWINNYKEALTKLNQPEEFINSIVINPEELSEDQFPIYLEKRSNKKLGNYNISGKFDLVMNGVLHDLKTCSVWAYIFDSNSKDYTLQGSIYKWLNQDIITSDIVNIEFEFTDWSAQKAKQDSSYPQHRILQKAYPLLTIEQTEQWIANKLKEIDHYLNLPNDQLPLCTSEELWAKEDIFKYYKDPNKMSRSTKNFDNAADAYARQASDGGLGVVILVPGEVKRCGYCNALPSCTQAENLIASGALKL